MCKDGTKTTVASTAGSLVTGQTYHIKIEVAGSSVKCYLDGVLKHSFNLPMERRVYVSSSIDDATGKLYVKIVNPNAEGQNTTLNLKGYHTTGGKMVQMTAATDKAENTTADPYMRCTRYPTWVGILKCRTETLCALHLTRSGNT